MSRRNPPSSDDERDLREVEDRLSHPDAPGDAGGGGEAASGGGGAEGAESAAGERPAWDANDPRRSQDCFAPPQEPCECYCLHCGRTFMSDQIWFQRIIGDPMGLDGFWMCPTPNCSGAGFTFDIFPTDPAHPGNEGWSYDDDEEEGDGEDYDGEFLDLGDEADGEANDWDPDETKYKELDEVFGDGDESDIEGEEWKYGLAPGERPPEPDWAEEARRQRDEEEQRYNEPDERPRILDWTHREDRKHFNDDDIPF
jgi:hypothetical protein